MSIEQTKIFYEKKPRRNFMSFYICFILVPWMISPIIFFQEPFELWLFPVVLTTFTIGLLSLRMLIWLIFGKERILIKETELIIQKRGTFMLSDRIIPIKDIRNLKLFKNLYEQQLGIEGFKGNVTRLSSRMPIIKIQNAGRIIIIDKNDKEYRILDGLNMAEGQLEIEKLNAILSSDINKEK